MPGVGALTTLIAIALNAEVFVPADGRCLLIAEYPALAKLLYNHKVHDFAYGRCAVGRGFRIPNLDSDSGPRYHMRIK